MEKNISKDKRLNFLIYFLWFCSLYGATNMIYSNDGNNYWLQQLLSDSNVFSINHLSVLSFSFYLILRYKNFYYKNKEHYVLFSFSALVVIVSYLNPNNVFSSINDILGREVKVLLIFLIFLYSILFFRKDFQQQIIFKIIKTGNIFLLIKGSFRLLLFLVGMGRIRSGHPVVIIQYDVLYWFALFQSLNILFFVISKKRKYLFISFFYMLILALSASRATFFIGSIPSAAILIFSSKKMTVRLKNIIVAFFLIFIIQLSLKKINPSLYERIFEKFSSVFYFGSGNERGYYSKYSNHYEQSIETTRYFFKNISRFWGIGFNTSGTETSFATGSSRGGIHNIYIFVWAKYGLHVLVYYLFLATIFISKMLKNFSKIRKNKVFLFKFGIGMIMSFYMLAWWSTGVIKTVFNSHLIMEQFLFFYLLMFVDNIDELIEQKNIRRVW